MVPCVSLLSWGRPGSWEKIQLHDGRAAAALKFRSPAGLVISLKTKQTENTLTIFQCLVQQRKCLLVGVLFLLPLSRTCLSSPNRDPAHMGHWLPFHARGTCSLLPVPLDWTPLGTSQKQNLTVFALLRLAYFIEHSVPKTHPCWSRWQKGLPFSGSVIVCRMDGSHCVYPFPR